MAILTAGISVLALGHARASTLSDALLILSVSTPSDSIDFVPVSGTNSWSTGPFTVGGYTISNITEEFVGSSLDNISDPLQFRLTGIDSITCDPCEPLEIDFAAIAFTSNSSGFYQDLETLPVVVGMDGYLGPGNDVRAGLDVLFIDGTEIIKSPLLKAGNTFSQFNFLSDVSGVPSFSGAFFLGCDCAPLAPGQVFSAPDSIFITFNAPEPASWMLLLPGLAGILLASRRARSKSARNS